MSKGTLPPMRAVAISPSHPTPSILKLPPPILPPSPFPPHLSIRVSHAALNPADWKLAKALAPGVKGPLVLGVDCAGIVVSRSPSAKIPIGARVVAFTRMGEQRKGGCFAEYCLAEEAACAIVPDNMSMEEAASLPVGFLTSAVAFHWPGGSLGIPVNTDGPTTKDVGRAVLVWGASSSTGTFAVQLAKLSGLKVIAVCSEKNFGLVKSLGADWTIDYKDTEKTIKEIVSLPLPQPLDIAVDCIGGSAANHCHRALALAGTGRAKLALISGSPTVPKEDGVEWIPVHLGAMYADKTQKALYQWVTTNWRTEFINWFAKGWIKPSPPREVISLDEVPLGMERMSRNEVSARKLVVKVWDSDAESKSKM